MAAPDRSTLNPEPSAAAVLPHVAEWLVDAFNVLHAGLLHAGERNEWWTERHRLRLIERASGFGPEGAIWLVFDGDTPAESDDDDRRRLRVVYAPSADDWILKRVRGSTSPERLAVVTADRKLADRARHRGARIVAPAVFLQACARQS